MGERWQGGYLLEGMGYPSAKKLVSLGVQKGEYCMGKTISKEQIQRAKQRFGIVGNATDLNRAIEVALLIAPTDVSVLVTGESGVGKESFPQIIHHNSIRKHGAYVAVNCGAIPEGTIDSELFGHKKGSFTDAVNERKGYFEVADGGTIFLDEVGELPLSTQARLLRVLESGEFMKVGSSEVQCTDIRVVAATNVNLLEAVKKGHFREDLLYRLNTVAIELPPLRERGEDITLLFRKFASDFADKYQMPPIRLSEETKRLLLEYSWPGNIRQLRNLVERLSVLAEDRQISAEALTEQLPQNAFVRHPALFRPQETFGSGGDAFYTPFGEQELSGGAYRGGGVSLETLHTLMREMKGNLGELSQLLYRILQSQSFGTASTPASLPPAVGFATGTGGVTYGNQAMPSQHHPHQYQQTEELTPSEEIEELVKEGEEPLLTLKEMEQKYIELVLKHNNGERKKTAKDLDISERTLYRKLDDSKK